MTRYRAWRILSATAVLVFFSITSSAWARSCEDLRSLALPNTEIKSAELVAQGSFVGPGNVKQPDMPAFCRVVAAVREVPDSDIEVEVWLPAEQWDGTFHGNGNGGFGGSLSAGYAGMEEGLLRGYVSAMTDTGTAPATTLNGDALIGHPQKWKDWGLISTHAMTVAGKALAVAFYGREPKRSYYTGCSTGGQQGLIEAQYYPEDYDGILVGAPVMNRTWGHALVLWNWLSANLLPGHKLSDTKLALLNKAAVSSCGTINNGLSRDPFIADPMACRFDPAKLTCRQGDADTCLTPAEVQTAKEFYSGPTDDAGHALYYGWLPGSETPGRNGWSFLQDPPNHEPSFDGLFKWVFGSDWDWRQFNFTRDMPKVNAVLAPSVNGVTTGDLAQFKARGGKLVMYQGWADTLVAPGQTIAFYKAQENEFGGVSKVQDFFRLFMAPGVMHCGGGPGPNVFNSANGAARKPPSNAPQNDLFTAMTRWVENGVAPSQVIATKYVDDVPSKGIASQRPLCAFPQKAWYKGSGDSNDSKNFVCSVQRPKI